VKKVKRFVLCLAFVGILAIALQPLIYANTSDLEPIHMEGTRWNVIVFEFDPDTGEFLRWYKDTFTFSRGELRVESLGPNGHAPYTESYHAVVPDLLTIWESTIWLDIGGWRRFIGVCSTKNPNYIVGKIESSFPSNIKFIGKLSP
jgi:hypothetical protein